MRLCSSADRPASVFIFSLRQGVRLELFPILHENMRSLYILGIQPYIVEKPISHAMALERLCLNTASPSVGLALSKHVQSGSLSRITHLRIAAVELRTTQQGISLVSCLFNNEWPQLTHLNLNHLTGKGFYELSEVTKQGKLKNISELSLIFLRSFRPWKYHTMDFLRSEFLPVLKKLTIHWFVRTNSVHSFEALATILRDEHRCLHKIDLSHNYCGVSGKLSILLGNELSELHTLILSDCQLNHNDLKSLTQAKVKGMIPELKHLDISLNDEICGYLDLLFENSSSWNSLLSLNVEWSYTHMCKADECEVCSPDLRFLSTKSSLLGSLRELRVSAINNTHMCMTSRWSCVTTLQVICVKNGDYGILSAVAEAVEGNLLPRLETVRILNYSDDDYWWSRRPNDDKEKTTIDALKKNLVMLRAANIDVLQYKLEDEDALADVGVNFFPFTQCTPNVGE